MLIFNSTVNKTHWDGRTNAGSIAPEGTYFYIINATSEGGTVFDRKGSLTLIR